MKRHPGLIPLSSHHQNALVQARKLKSKQVSKDPDKRLQVAREFLGFWDSHGRNHFREEEDLLLPAVSRFGDAWTPAVQEMLHQHIVIRGWVATLEECLEDPGGPSCELLKDLGEMLDRHVRLEEHEVFPWAEKVLPEEELSKLKEKLQA